MKKMLAMGAVALTASSAAMSQTSSPTVEVYGIADAGVMRVSGLRGGSVNYVASGIMEGTGRTWNDPAKFVYDAHKGFWGHNNTLSHDIV